MGAYVKIFDNCHSVPLFASRLYSSVGLDLSLKNPSARTLEQALAVNISKTIVFADIAGSTGLYEIMGNAGATRAVTALTRDMGLAIKFGAGRVVKKLGDGVLGVFEEPGQAIAAMVRLMREHTLRSQQLPLSHRLQMRIGLASGAVVEVDGDCYGDTVNVASRLCERAGPGEIFATEDTVQAMAPQRGVQPIRLGHLEIRGKAESLVAYQIEWREEEDEASLTLQAGLPSVLGSLEDKSVGSITMEWKGQRHRFSSADGSLHLGRATDCHLCVDDPRVSRLHARIDWRKGTLVLTDLSSFGSWVRFEGSSSLVSLRRDACLLHGRGQIAMGVTFADHSAPVISFEVSGAA